MSSTALTWGGDRAPVLRWAIALDDGRLVFAAEGASNSPEAFRPKDENHG